MLVFFCVVQPRTNFQHRGNCPFGLEGEGRPGALAEFGEVEAGGEESVELTEIRDTEAAFLSALGQCTLAHPLAPGQCTLAHPAAWS